MQVFSVHIIYRGSETGLKLVVFCESFYDRSDEIIEEMYIYLYFILYIFSLILGRELFQ